MGAVLFEGDFIIITVVSWTRGVRAVDAVVPVVANAVAIHTFPVVRAVCGADISEPSPHVADDPG